MSALRKIGNSLLFSFQYKKGIIQLGIQGRGLKVARLPLSNHNLTNLLFLKCLVWFVWISNQPGTILSIPVWNTGWPPPPLVNELTSELLHPFTIHVWSVDLTPLLSEIAFIRCGINQVPWSCFHCGINQVPWSCLWCGINQVPWSGLDMASTRFPGLVSKC